MALDSSNWFRQTIVDAMANTAAVDLNGTGLKIALFTNSHAGSVDFSGAATNVYGSAPWNANEVSGTGYTAGGQLLDSPTCTVASSALKFDAADFIGDGANDWASSSITARGGLIYDTGAGNRTIVLLNFGADISSTSGPFSITFHANGIFTIS